MIEELSEEYIPNEILHREEQTEKIREIFSNFKKNKVGTNCLILGVTGSGKTVLIKKIIKEEDNSLYISCDNTLTAYKTLKFLFGINSKTHQETLDLAIKELKKNPKVIIIDEIDKIDRAEEFNKLMSNLNTIYRKTMVPIILITLKRDILKMMKPDVRKTLLPEKIHLPSYNANELRDILESRLSNIKLDIKEDDKYGIISYISCLAAQQGSARILINIILKCIQKNDFTHDFIEESYKNTLKEDWISFVNDINTTERQFLRVLLDNCDFEKEISAEEIEKEMELTRTRIYQLINIFEKYFVVISRHENFGRAGGRKRYIKFSSKETYDELKLFVEK